jgi:glycine/D-amino acid oxidase-like deaminating enzyme
LNINIFSSSEDSMTSNENRWRNPRGEQPGTVILGAGVMGISTAYYLSDGHNPSSIHLVEPAPAFFAWAGNAGGFIAEDWVCFPKSLKPVAVLSFEEYKKLAEKFRGKKNWGYEEKCIGQVRGYAVCDDVTMDVRGTAKIIDATNKFTTTGELHKRRLWLGLGDFLEERCYAAGNVGATTRHAQW